MKTTEELGQALTVSEVARRLRLTQKTIRRYAKKLGAIRLGRKWIFFERCLEDAVLRQTEEKMESPRDERGGKETSPLSYQEKGDRLRGSLPEDRELEEEIRKDVFGAIGKSKKGGK